MFAEQGPAEIVFVAQQYLEAGAWDQALALCQAFEELDSPALVLCRAVATFVSGDREAALALVEGVLERSPGQLSALGVKAQMLARSGAGAAELTAETAETQVPRAPLVVNVQQSRHGFALGHKIYP